MELFPQPTEINILPICFILRKQSTEKGLGDLSNRIVLRLFKEKLQANISRPLSLMINLRWELFYITQGAFAFLYKTIRRSLQHWVLLPSVFIVERCIKTEQKHFSCFGYSIRLTIQGTVSKLNFCRQRERRVATSGLLNLNSAILSDSLNIYM